VSKSNALETALLQLLFNATAFANMADNAASSPNTSLYVSLHTADPGEAGDQTTNETNYTSYARVAVARTAGGWTVAAGSVSPAANIDFPQCTGLTATITHLGIGKASSGAGVLFYSGPVSPNISVSTGVTPRLGTGTSVTED
jgi:hypothetical protein